MNEQELYIFLWFDHDLLPVLSWLVNNLLHIQHLLLDLNLLLSTTEMTRFIKMFIYQFFAIIILFKNCINEFINCIFTSINSNWFAKFIINTYNFTSKTARNLDFSQCMKITFKIRINLKWCSYFFEIIFKLDWITF